MITYRIRNSSNTQRAMLTTESEVWYTSNYPCAYPQDTIGYAACRFIMHCSKARDSLIADAVRLRPGRGKASRPLIRLIRTKANDLELEGKYATIHVTVSQGMITVKGVEVTGDDNQCIMNYRQQMMRKQNRLLFGMADVRSAGPKINTIRDMTPFTATNATDGWRKPAKTLIAITAQPVHFDLRLLFGRQK